MYNKLMRKFSTKKVREIWGWTEKCYYDALTKTLSEFYGAYVPDFGGDIKDLKRFAVDAVDTTHYEQFHVVADREYQRLLRLLPTDQIRLILACHESRQIKRAQHTIDSLLQELLDRAMHGHQEPSRSYKKKNGKAKGKTVKRSSPKTKGKTSNG